MALRLANVVGVRRALGLNISYSFSSRFSTSQQYPQGINVVDGSTSTPRHGKNEDDVVSSRIRKSLDNDDGRDYAEGENGGRRTAEDLTWFMAEKAKKGTRKTMETAFNAGVSVAEGMEQTLGAAKETTEKVKEAVLGDEHERARDNRRHDKAAEERLRKSNPPGDFKWRA